ncbi:HEC/Ndc80p family-domain-containing protein [Mrakia frigida]|uniref:HEC/Ndc80p family-domain-containing protein n=1 Tax=Mrakia frigida TaxID=29902 RepID=UPI003FCC26E7
MSLAGGPPVRAQPQQPQQGGAGGQGGGAQREGRRTTQLHNNSAGGSAVVGAGAGAGAGGSSQGAGGVGGPPSGNRGDGGMYGRTPRGGGNASLRRSSTYAPRPSGITPSHGSTLLPAQHQKDTRPIKDKLFQSSCHQSILTYFASQSPRAPAINQKSVTSPTQQEFQLMFKFLCQSVIDEDYVFGKGGKKFEEECLGLLKDLRYPAVDTLSRTSIGAPGSPHQWPSLLAMLAWLVDLSDLKRNWITCEVYEDYELLPAEEIPLDAPTFDVLLQRDYMVNTYRQWVDGAEEFPEEDQKLEDNYERKFADIIESGEALHNEVANQEAEFKALTSEPNPLLALDEEYRLVNEDLVKYNNTVVHQEGKKEKATKGIQTLLETIEQLQSESALLRSEKLQVLTAVKQQGLSPEEVSRMNSDKETLTRSFEDIRTKVLSAQKYAYEREMAVSKRGDSLETYVTEYMNLAYRLGIHPPPVDHQTGRVGEDYSMELNLNGGTSMEILGGVDVNGRVRPGLMRFAEGKRGEKSRVEAEIIRVDNELDRLLQVVEGLKDDGDILAGKLRGMNSDADAEKQANTEDSAALLAAQQQVERDIASTRGVSRQALIAAESKVESLKIEHGKLVHRTNKIRDDTIADVIAQTEFIIKFKEIASNALEGLKRYAETN